MTSRVVILSFLLVLSPFARSAELAGVTVDDVVTAKNGDTLVLNGLGLREKFWVDVYVGSLYLTAKTSQVVDILSSQTAFRIQMDFVYKEVDKEKLVTAWREGFEKNQSAELLVRIKDRMQQFYDFFNTNAVAKDQFVLDYIPGEGTTVAKNGQVLGTIPGDDFKNAVLEIWLGNIPADKDLKRGMLGLN
ncbi:MAG: chalcone isomerase [Gammaproteobacteria bacterium]|nr:chalcone isomerase [Gammaproteobacteria bacterium]